jgi:hypothetical protein
VPSVMFGPMESASDDDLISSIAPDVMKCLREIHHEATFGKQRNAVPPSYPTYAPTPIRWSLRKVSRSKLIRSALVVGMPCGKPV